MNDALDPIEALTRDLRTAARTLSPHEVRFLVDYYYALQKVRTRANLTAGAHEKSAEPGEVLQWLGREAERFESNIRRALGAYSDNNPVGRWADSIHGVGPVLSAGLLAHIDITRAPTVGHIWSFGGWDPEKTWEKNKRRPWNARLKVLFWKLGDSFVKVHNSPKDIYGHVYAARKALEESRNQQGLFRAQAQKTLSEVKFRKDTVTRRSYEQGVLPAGRIDLRARRVAVKLFLSHWHTVAWFCHTGALPPAPYPIAFLPGHTYIPVPNAHLCPGLEELMDQYRLTHAGARGRYYAG